MYNKKEFKKIKNMVETICKSCDNYQDNIKALEIYFTRLTDENSPRKNEFNEKYNIIKIANAKMKKGFICDYKDLTKLVVDFYIYEDAPKGFIIVLNQMEKWENKWIQKDIDIFVKED